MTEINGEIKVKTFLLLFLIMVKIYAIGCNQGNFHRIVSKSLNTISIAMGAQNLYSDWDQLWDLCITIE